MRTRTSIRPQNSNGAGEHLDISFPYS